MKHFKYYEQQEGGMEVYDLDEKGVIALAKDAFLNGPLVMAAVFEKAKLSPTEVSSYKKQNRERMKRLVAFAKAAEIGEASDVLEIVRLKDSK